ncbi:hypothetical protein HUX62_01480 [Massilia sp. BJB1822]|nr:hypothetical protein [Massilia sp. BJB1822]
MTTEIIDHATLTELAEAGIVDSAYVIGHAGGWGILVKDGSAKRMLAAQRGQPARVFRELETLVAYLKELGIQRFEVDAAHYTPDNPTAAASYTKWLKAEVQEAIDDPSPTVAHDEAMRQIRAAIKQP